MVLLTMRSSGEVQPPGAVHGAGMDPAKAHLRRHRFRSKVSWHGERHWRPAANWIPQPRSARIHWMGVSGAFKESTDRAISSKSRWLASSGRGGHFFHSKRVRAASRDRFELRSQAVGRPRQNEIHMKTKRERKLAFLLQPITSGVSTAPGRVQRLVGPPLGRSRSYNPLLAQLGIAANRPIWAQLTRRRAVSAAEYAPGVAPMTKVAPQRMWSVPQSRPLLASIPRVATRR